MLLTLIHPYNYFHLYFIYTEFGCGPPNNPLNPYLPIISTEKDSEGLYTKTTMQCVESKF